MRILVAVRMEHWASDIFEPQEGLVDVLRFSATASLSESSLELFGIDSYAVPPNSSAATIVGITIRRKPDARKTCASPSVPASVTWKVTQMAF